MMSSPLYRHLGLVRSRTCSRSYQQSCPACPARLRKRCSNGERTSSAHVFPTVHAVLFVEMKIDETRDSSTSSQDFKDIFRDFGDSDALRWRSLERKDTKKGCPGWISAEEERGADEGPVWRKQIKTDSVGNRSKPDH